MLPISGPKVRSIWDHRVMDSSPTGSKILSISKRHFNAGGMGLFGFLSHLSDVFSFSFSQKEACI